MKPAARFRRHDFGLAVGERLAARGQSIRQFCAAHPWISVAAVSRAMNARPLATENLLALARALDIDPYDHFSVENQPVSAPVSRETSSASGAAGAPAGRRKGGDAQSRLPASLGGIGGILERVREGAK